MNSFSENELKILETIHSARENNEYVHQRDLAHIVGVSLGMTNAILKRLAKKGLLTIKKVNNRNIHYAVSPEGVKAITERSYRYFKRTIKNVVFYKEKIEILTRDVHAKGYATAVLVGKSDLDFIVEHFCMKYGLNFKRSDHQVSAQEGEYLFYSERYDIDGFGQPQRGYYLRTLLM